MIEGFVIDASICGDDSKVFIGCPDGEGGDFNRVEFEAAVGRGRIFGNVRESLNTFFWENF
jgi:hypothetical protein